jgi:hypothetical protein
VGGVKYVLPEEYVKHLRVSAYPFRDAIYNALVKLHARKGKPWTTEGFFSDKLFWNTFLDQVWSWIPSLAFIYLMYIVATYTFDKYGLFRAVTVIAVLVLVRVNSVIRQISLTNRLLAKIEKKSEK